MFRFYIFYQDLEYANLISDTILSTVKNVQLVGINTTITKSCIEYCNSIHPHLIIADEKTQKKLLSLLNFKYFTINILQNESPITKKICNQVKKLSEDSKNIRKLDLGNFRNDVLEELRILQFNPTFLGTRYLLDCIIFIHENPNFNLSKTNLKYVYTLVAQKYNTTLDVVMWNIHTAIDDMYRLTNKDFREKIYGDNIVTPQQIMVMFSSYN